MTVFGFMLLALPWLAGLWGLGMALNLFGLARREMDFYRGRGNWYPILNGDETFTHRLAGSCMVCFAVAVTWVMVSSGTL